MLQHTTAALGFPFFCPLSARQKVFAEVLGIVQSAPDGFNVCLFSYDKTGFGNTHTMQGSGTGEMGGIMPRTVEQVGFMSRKWHFLRT